MASKSSTATNSGIRKLSNGASVIPSSTRPDGSVRKEIRVKPGYKPPEDVEVYKNRTAAAWKNRGKGGIPGAEAVGEKEQGSQSAAANKNAKRREARKKAAAAVANDEETKEDGGVVEGELVDAANGDGSGQVEQQELDADADKGKEARKLAKKLRQARELEEKKEKGDNLLPEQFAKVIKINELIRQLDSLGFDADGEQKADGNQKEDMPAD